MQLNGFLRLKEVWDDIKSLHEDFGAVDDELWEQVTELVNVLEFPYLATKAMERRDFCYTDLYLWWLRIELKLDEIIADSPHFDFATILKTNLKIREGNLFKTPMMMSALYLDPRFKARLNTNEASIATETLKKLFVSMKSQPEPSPNAELNAIDRRIEAEMLNNYRSTNSEAEWRAELTMVMSSYNAARVTDINRTAIDFWKDNKHIYPQLYALSKIIFATASSISETERTFSSFSYIYNARRMSLLPENVTNVLMIRLNKDLFYDLKNSQINAVKISSK